MNQPMFFQRRPEVVQAIQYTGSNDEEVRHFMNGDRRIIFKNDWIVRRSNGTIEIYQWKEFSESFMQKNETI